MHYLLIYELADDYLQRRSEFRAEHLALAEQAAEEGSLLAGGAVQDPVDTAILFFQGDGPTVAEQFAREDPYVKNGLIKSWQVREWTTVAGPLAATPVSSKELS